MSTLQSYEGILLDGRAVRIGVCGDKIVSEEAIERTPGMARLLPVLVDLQQNGAHGLAFNNLHETAPNDLETIGDHLLKNGVGRVLATFTTTDYAILQTAATAVREALDRDEHLNRLFFGIFHEGVFISPDYGWRGGHDPKFIQPPDYRKFSDLQERSGNRIRMVNIAPEVEGALEFISRAADAGIKVALGHCHPSSEVIREAVARGATMVTHFANGAAPEIHRFKNPFWEFLSNDRLSLGLVGDGFHLPSEVARTALATKGTEKCFMVSDASIHSGRAPGVYQRIGGEPCQIEANGFIHVVNSEILAGAWFQNNRSVEYLVNRIGIEFETAWKLCSTIPAQLIGIDLPDLSPGAEASFVQAEFTDGELHLHQVVFCGQEIGAPKEPSSELHEQ